MVKVHCDAPSLTIASIMESADLANLQSEVSMWEEHTHYSLPMSPWCPWSSVPSASISKVSNYTTLIWVVIIIMVRNLHYYHLNKPDLLEKTTARTTKARTTKMQVMQLQHASGFAWFKALIKAGKSSGNRVKVWDTSILKFAKVKAKYWVNFDTNAMT